HLGDVDGVELVVAGAGAVADVEHAARHRDGDGPLEPERAGGRRAAEGQDAAADRVGARVQRAADVERVDAVEGGRVAGGPVDGVGAAGHGDAPPGVGVGRLLHVVEAVVQFVGGVGGVAVAGVGRVVHVPAERQGVAAGAVGQAAVGQVAGHRLARRGGDVDV